MQARLSSGSDVYNFDATTGWKISASSWSPSGAGLEPQIGAGVPSPDYPGGDLVAEVLRDVITAVPLRYEGNAPAAALRGLESFVRRGVALNNLEFQTRDDMAFTAEPMWGQWGAWRRQRVIGARPVQTDSEHGIGVRNGWLRATLQMTVRPVIEAQPQLAALALGDVGQVLRSGVVYGVQIAEDDAGTLRMPELVMNGGGAFTFVFVWERGADSFTTGHKIIEVEHAAPLTVYFDNLTTRWYIEDGAGGQAYAAATMPDAGEWAHIVITHDPVEEVVTLYVDGVFVQELRGAVINAGAVFVGTDSSGTSEVGGIFRVAAAYAAQLAADEIAADYANMVKALDTGDLSPSPPLYVWFPGSDNILDNTRDDTGSTGAPHYNYAWVGGVAGTLPAATTVVVDVPGTYGAIVYAWLSLAPFTNRFDVLGYFVVDDAGHTSQSSSTGGAGATETLTTSWLPATAVADFDDADGREILTQLMGRQVCMFWRVTGGTAGARQVRAAVQLMAGATVYSPVRAANSASAYRLDRTAFVTVPVLDVDALSGASSLAPQHKRTSGSGNVVTDHFTIMVRPVARLSAVTTGAEAVAVRDGRAYRIPSTTVGGYAGGITAIANAYSQGDVLRAHPNRENLLALVMGDSTVDPSLSFSAAVYVEVTPRWSVV